MSESYDSLTPNELYKEFEKVLFQMVLIFTSFSQREGSADLIAAATPSFSTLAGLLHDKRESKNIVGQS